MNFEAPGPERLFAEHGFAVVGRESNSESKNLRSPELSTSAETAANYLSVNCESGYCEVVWKPQKPKSLDS